MGEAQHTPTPWFADPDDREGYEWNIHIVQESNRDMRVCFMTNGPEAGPNSAFIVAAVNSHATLTAALVEAREVLEAQINDLQNALDFARMVINAADADRLWKEGNIAAKDLLAALDRARAALATINAALGRVEG